MHYSRGVAALRRHEQGPLAVILLPRAGQGPIAAQGDTVTPRPRSRAAHACGTTVPGGRAQVGAGLGGWWSSRWACVGCGRHGTPGPSFCLAAVTPASCPSSSEEGPVPGVGGMGRDSRATAVCARHTFIRTPAAPHRSLAPSLPISLALSTPPLRSPRLTVRLLDHLLPYVSQPLSLALSLTLFLSICLTARLPAHNIFPPLPYPLSAPFPISLFRPLCLGGARCATRDSKASQRARSAL
jgi:hypothetical protein